MNNRITKRMQGLDDMRSDISRLLKEVERLTTEADAATRRTRRLLENCRLRIVASAEETQDAPRRKTLPPEMTSSD